MKNYPKITSTKEIKVSSKIFEQIIGQDHALDIIKKAAKQRRNVLLIGSPGTGKSMIGQALAELLPKEKLVDILAFPNLTDENTPLIRVMPAGQARDIIRKAKLRATTSLKNQTWIMLILVIFISLLPYYFWKTGQISDIIYASSMITGTIFVVGIALFINLSKRTKLNQLQVPKLLIDNSEKKKAPFLEATGAHAGALLGDVLHDPLQSFVTNKLQQIIEIGNKKDKQLQIKEIEMDSVINDLIKKHNNELIRKNNYIATYLDKNELSVLSENKGVAEPAEALSVNKYSKKGELIKIVTRSGKELIVTPEHKVAVRRFGKIIYKEAQRLTRFDKVITITS